MKLKLKLDTDESKERWELIKQAAKEVEAWDELKKAEASPIELKKEHSKSQHLASKETVRFD